MFKNIGKKIKVLAKVLCWIGIVLSVISGIAVMASGNNTVSLNGSYAVVSPVITGLIVIVIGCLMSWIGSFFAYGFGQLIENSDEIRKNISK